MKGEKLVNGKRLSGTSMFATIHKQRQEIPDIKIEGNDREKKSYNIGMFGATRVGKSALLAKILYNRFPTEYIPTVSEVYETKVRQKDANEITTYLYDTAIDFPVMNKLTMNKCDACIIVYAIDSLRSFEIAQQQMLDLSEMKGKLFPCILIGNKNDLDNEEVTFDQGLRCAVKSGASYMQISAKNDENLSHILETVVKRIKLSAMRHRSSSNLQRADLIARQPSSPIVRRINQITTLVRSKSCSAQDDIKEEFKPKTPSFLKKKYLSFDSYQTENVNKMSVY